MATREELISMKLNEFRDFVVLKRDDISSCSFDVQNGFYSYVEAGDYETIKNIPTGEKQVKIIVLFSHPCPGGEQDNIVRAIEGFVKIIQEGLTEKKIEVDIFAIELDIDRYIKLGIDYIPLRTLRRNQSESLMDMIALYAREVKKEE